MKLTWLSRLTEGVIGGAVLDVFENEPLPQESPLWQLPNVYITPHTAAISFPGRYRRNFYRELPSVPAAGTLHHVVDFELGY